ncbi:MAG: hypothetical protein KKA54_02385 [Proteobacteria bacterium]|nr:hypothetical protein [Pseudomonadota bacterium]
MAPGNHVIVDIWKNEDDKNTLKELLKGEKPVRIISMLHAEDTDPHIHCPAKKLSADWEISLHSIN